VLGLEVAAGDEFDRDVVAEGVAAFALDRLALARGERGEKFVEVAIAGVDEMKLLADARDETGLLQRFAVGPIGEGDVDRGSADRLA
jgi:hypothetical protein